MDGVFYGGKSLVEELAARLPRMTVEEVNGAIRRHLRPESLSVAVVADAAGAEAFVDRLAANAPSPIVYQTPSRPDVLAEDGDIAVEPLPVVRARCRVVPAESMFSR
jgi:zinc protease